MSCQAKFVYLCRGAGRHGAGRQWPGAGSQVPLKRYVSPCGDRQDHRKMVILGIAGAMLRVRSECRRAGRSVPLRRFVFAVLLMGVLSCSSSKRTNAPLASLSLPEGTRQILLVRTPSWDAAQGTMDLYVRRGESWEKEHGAIPVVLGRAGLAWGLGLHDEGLPGPQKVEGDGHAPAGLYELGTSFGYDGNSPAGLRYPYRQATAHDYFIDDVDSPDYNRWVSLADSADKAPERHWRSFERMRRNDDLYELGLVVRHNMHPARTGKGSAIFLHVWRGADQPTAGCTAMSGSDMLKLLHWLDPEGKPLLLQLPAEVPLPPSFQQTSVER